MILQSLLVSKDDYSAEVLSRALANFAIAVERFSEPEIAQQRLGEQRFDCLIVDFDDADTALKLLEMTTRPKPAALLSIALSSDENSVREILKKGAKFVLQKPISSERVAATLGAATALLRRERRRSFRVPVQAPVQVALPGGEQLEGIMLDLSQTGMDLLAAQPLQPAALIGLRFTLPDGSLEIDTHGEIAWANPNGQSGVRFLDLPETQVAKLKTWLLDNAAEVPPDEPDPVSACKLTDLSLGGCYVETESPFPQRALVDLCLKAADIEIHADGIVRVMHPGAGMGVEFPSRTSAQRETVSHFIEFLTSRPGTMPELLISPKAIVADESQFQQNDSSIEEHLDDPLAELLRNGEDLSQDAFLSELHKQRNPEAVASN